MNLEIREQFKSELVSRGYSGSMAPNETMWLDDDYLDNVSVGDLMIELVARREKIFGSADVVGMEQAKRGYEDVVAAVEALKVVVNRMAELNDRRTYEFSMEQGNVRGWREDSEAMSPRPMTNGADILREIRLLIHEWCDRKELNLLSALLPAYRAVNGLTDGWEDLRQGVRQGIAMQVSGEDHDRLRDVERALDRMLRY